MKLRACLVFLLLCLVISTTLATIGSAFPSSRPLAIGYEYNLLAEEHKIIGEQRVLVILVDFQDFHHSKSPDEIKKVALDQLDSYYHEVSYGMVSISGQTYGWYTTGHTMGYYGHDSRKPGDDDNLGSLANDALAMLPPSVSVDSFDFLVIVHAGKDQAADQSRALSDEIWSSELSEIRLNLGSRYFQKSCAFLSEFDSVGTFAHEWGHLFGLPDFYSYDGGSYVGHWSLMDSAELSYIGAWGDWKLGWLSPSIPEENTLLSSFTLYPLESPQVSSVMIPLSSSTYYFIEYRTRTGLDSQLPSSGILIYYVDENVESGHGIIKLVNPSNSTVLVGPVNAEVLDEFAFAVGNVFRDPTNHVYITFLAGHSSILLLYSRQEGALNATPLKTILEPSATHLTGSYGDRIPLSGVLIDEKGGPLAGQSVEVDLFSSDWQTIWSGTTDQEGRLSFEATLDYDVGSYRCRFVYAGGNIGNGWYESSSAEFELDVTPGRMMMTLSTPGVAGTDYVAIGVSMVGLHGQPLAGILLTVYVDGVRRGVTETDGAGHGELILQLELQAIGSHTIKVKASNANYLTIDSSHSIFIFPPLWISVITVLIIISAVAIALMRARPVPRTGRGILSRGRQIAQAALAPPGLICPRCGTQSRRSSVFCRRCGTSVRQIVTASCAFCGMSNRYGATFCRRCGRRLP